MNNTATFISYKMRNCMCIHLKVITNNPICKFLKKLNFLVKNFKPLRNIVERFSF